MGRKEVTVLEEGTFEGPEVRKGASCVENQERSVPGTGDASTKPRGQKALSAPKKLRPPGEGWQAVGGGGTAFRATAAIPGLLQA